MSTYNLCGKKKGCCPTVDIVANTIRIKDDYGGNVVLSKQEIVELIDIIKSEEK